MLLLENVRKSYLEPGGQRLPILDIENFTLSPGEQVVLRGASGGGKTTLLNCLAGLTTVDQGQIHINGHDITAMAEVTRDRFRARFIGYVFQTFNLLPAFTALENVLLGMTFTGQKADPDRASQLLENLGLGARLAHKPEALSVGEQQRVGVARALANRPLLLLADEPTANVDPGHQQQIIELLRQACQQENIAMLLVTHAPEVANQFDRVEQLEKVNRVKSGQGAGDREQEP
ncbi:MAG: ABC transporter ATP-binding protein [Pirellulales bacterium]